jgi:hypothetical protein
LTAETAFWSLAFNSLLASGLFTHVLHTNMSYSLSVVCVDVLHRVHAL